MAAVAALTGCADDETRPHAAAGHGGQGSHSGTAADEPEPVTPPPGADWNADDAAYLTAMIHHHRQAIEMSELAATRAADPAVRTLADGIGAGQGTEILTMAAWLDSRSLDVPTLADIEGGHVAHATMPGMLSQDQMADLGAASGASFDELFLTSMVQHHLGAVEMAEHEVAQGLDTVVVDMATEVIAGQTAEIRRMRQLLAR
jgi:uncharacterized protein (DUF305 family)